MLCPGVRRLEQRGLVTAKWDVTDTNRKARFYAIAIGDVSGKGISASLMMATLRAYVRGLTALGEADLCGLMSNLNNRVLAATELIRHIMAEADAYLADAPQHDDMTLVVLRFI